MHPIENTLDAVIDDTLRPAVGIDRASLHAARRRRHWHIVERGIERLYGARRDEVVSRLDLLVAEAAARRPESLVTRDTLREAEPDWFAASSVVGYVAYADLFAGDLVGVAAHLDYLRELGVSYLHLMPLLRAREGANDGGYAVVAYDEVEPRLGTIDDLRQLADALHERGMNLCIDLVVNHTAAEHPWAIAARAGDARFRAYYRFFPDRAMPDEYERTLREVFPTFAPGNFTWLEDCHQWVWTTFNEFQWDLDWSNPDVFIEMVGVMIGLADLGVDVLRLDAVPFMWKRLGTDCENLPEVHILLSTLRAVMAIVAPATIFKAEAIVPPDLLTPYLGAGEPERHECDLAYHNQLMVLLWSSLATGDAQLMANSLRRMGQIPDHASWVTYVRCHDDIGWAITDDLAMSVGWTGFEHRRFLNEFFSGRFPMSFAEGEIFQLNPATGDGRISGTTASLCGVGAALGSGDGAALERGLHRLELVYAVAYSFGGVPLLYMGDELALTNDRSYLLDRSRRDDNRWMHRPPMDWAVAARRGDPTTLEHRVFSMFRSLACDRAALDVLHGSVAPEIIDAGGSTVFVIRRRHPERGDFVMIANFGHDDVTISLVSVSEGSRSPSVVRLRGAHLADGLVHLESLGYVWLSGGGTS